MQSSVLSAVLALSGSVLGNVLEQRGISATVLIQRLQQLEELAQDDLDRALKLNALDAELFPLNMGNFVVGTARTIHSNRNKSNEALAVRAKEPRRRSPGLQGPGKGVARH